MSTLPYARTDEAAFLPRIFAATNIFRNATGRIDGVHMARRTYRWEQNEGLFSYGQWTYIAPMTIASVSEVRVRGAALATGWRLRYGDLEFERHPEGVIEVDVISGYGTLEGIGTSTSIWTEQEDQLPNGVDFADAQAGDILIAGTEQVYHDGTEWRDRTGSVPSGTEYQRVLLPYDVEEAVITIAERVKVQTDTASNAALPPEAVVPTLTPGLMSGVERAIAAKYRSVG